MEEMSARIVAVLAVLVVPCLPACDSGSRDAGEWDAGADAGTDADADSDADSGVDSGTPDYWSWNEVEIPNGAFCYSYAELRVLALGDTDIVVCSGYLGEVSGGLAEFDGTSLTSDTLPSGSTTDFGCEGLWIDGVWTDEAVEGFEGCFSGTGSCDIQAMFEDASGLPHAVGWLDASWWAPSPGTRAVWSRDPETGDWTLDDTAVFPPFDLLTGASAGTGSPGIQLPVLGGDVTYWGGDSVGSGSHVFEVEAPAVNGDASVVDLDASVVDL